jgi:hypothetical protein
MQTWVAKEKAWQECLWCTLVFQVPCVSSFIVFLCQYCDCLKRFFQPEIPKSFERGIEELIQCVTLAFQYEGLAELGQAHSLRGSATREGSRRPG